MLLKVFLTVLLRLVQSTQVGELDVRNPVKLCDYCRCEHQEGAIAETIRNTRSLAECADAAFSRGHEYFVTRENSLRCDVFIYNEAIQCNDNRITSGLNKNWMIYHIQAIHSGELYIQLYTGIEECGSGYDPVDTFDECDYARIQLGIEGWNGDSLHQKRARGAFCWVGNAGKSNFNPNDDFGETFHSQSHLICKILTPTPIVELDGARSPCPTDTPFITPTSNPTLFPTENPTSDSSAAYCESASDSTTYTFGTFELNGEYVTRDCDFITENPATIFNRRTEWCTVEYEGTMVQDECPVACGVCAQLEDDREETLTESSVSPKKPNVLLIFVDDVGTGDVPGYWGNENDGLVNMENIYTEFVLKGTTFSDIHSTPLCAPSRYLLLSGNYVHRGRSPAGSWSPQNANQFLDGQKGLAEVLRDGGNYHTFMTGKYHLGGRIPPDGASSSLRDVDLRDSSFNWTLPIGGGPQDIGFDKSWIATAGIQSPPFTWFEDGYLVTDLDDIRWWKIGEYEMPGGLSKINKHSGQGDPDWDSSQYATKLVQRTIQFLDEHLENRPDDPFFAYVSTCQVHIPHSPPNEFFGTPVAGTHETPFLDMLYELDLMVGIIIEALEERELIEDTIVIFASDNGGLQDVFSLSEQFGHFANGPLRGGKNTIYEGGHRVPFIIRYDGVIPAGATRSQLLGLNDLFATICDLVGVDVPQGQALDSVSFADYIFNNNPMNLREHLGVWRIGWGEIWQEMIRNQQFKLILDHDSERMELYDMNADIEETINLILDPALRDTVGTLFDAMGEITPNMYDFEEFKQDALEAIDNGNFYPQSNGKQKRLQGFYNWDEP